MSDQFVYYDKPGAPQVASWTWEKVVEASDCNEPPDKNDEGFWPSRNPEDAGYMGAVTDEAFEKAMQEAEDRMHAWRCGDWWYVGVRARLIIEVPVGQSGFRQFTLESAGLWGIESDCGDAHIEGVFNEEKCGLVKDLGELVRALNIIIKEEVNKP